VTIPPSSIDISVRGTNSVSSPVGSEMISPIQSAGRKPTENVSNIDLPSSNSGPYRFCDMNSPSRMIDTEPSGYPSQTIATWCHSASGNEAKESQDIVAP